MALSARRALVNGSSGFRLGISFAQYEEPSLIRAGRLFHSSASNQRPHTAGQTVVTERKGVVVTVGINRPQARNSVNRETASKLIKELSAFDQDDTLSVAVLHGMGGYFCAGLDLKELSTGPDSLKLVQDVTQGPGPMGPSRMTLSKPLIAAVSGYAVAGGLELALLADIRVVEESTIFGVFCRRFGVPLIDGGTVRLPALIGLSRALDLILTGRPVGAKEALALGLANRVVPDGQAGQTVVTERKGAVVTVGINRPEARNAVNRETARRLTKELSAFDQDDSLSVAVLHGIGGNFCAGYDLKELSQDDASVQLEQDVSQGLSPMGPSRMRLSKPLIAAVSGYAVAGGFELALLADIRVVEESAIMGVFCRRFGVPLIDGGTVRLPALIGLSRALDLILTGRPVGAQEALAYGLANRVVPDGQALQAAVELAEQISSFPQLCLRADRNSAYHSSFDSSSFIEAMQFEMDYGQPIIAAESVKGAGRFAAGTGRGGKFFEPDQKQYVPNNNHSK